MASAESSWSGFTLFLRKSLDLQIWQDKGYWTVYVLILRYKYSKTCVKRPLSKSFGLVFKTNYPLMQSNRSILQYCDLHLATICY